MKASQGFVDARQALYHLSYILSPSLCLPYLVWLGEGPPQPPLGIIVLA